MSTVPIISRTARYGYIPCFDGLRGLAIVLVVFRHFEVSKLLPGGFGVTTFFVISGVLITRLLLAENETNHRIDLLRFYMRRFVRLMPPLALMIVVTAIVMAVAGIEYSWPSLTSSLFYFRNYYSWYHQISGYPLDTRIWEPTWSLAVEEHFYLIFPVFLISLGSRPKIATWAIVIACIASLVWRCVVWFILPNADYYNYHATDARLDAILTGCLLSFAIHHVPNATLWKRISAPWIFWASAVSIVVTLLIRGDFYLSAVRYSLQQFLVLLIIFHLLFVDAHHRVKAFLEHPVLRYLGRLSYSLYLWHLACFLAFQQFFQIESQSVNIVMGLVISLAVAACSFHFFEMPLVELRKRFGAHVPTETTEGEPRDPALTHQIADS